MAMCMRVLDSGSGCRAKLKHHDGLDNVKSMTVLELGIGIVHDIACDWQCQAQAP
jgi:hypothetical protein